MQFIAWIVLFLVGKETEKLRWFHFVVIACIASALSSISIVLRNMEDSQYGIERHGATSVENFVVNAVVGTAMFSGVYLIGF